MKPNILLIVVDQMRRDCLGIMDHPIIETPNLDMLKKQGVFFRNAYSAVPTCIAARAALMTGLSQEKHGRVGYEDGVPWRYTNTLAGEFKKAGYHTQCVGKMHVYPTRNRLGFDDVKLHNGYLHHDRVSTVEYKESGFNCDDYLPWLKRELGHNADIIDTGLDCNSWVARPWPYPEYTHPTNWVVAEAIDFLRRKDPTCPFFLKTSFVRPHSPLDPPQTYYDMYINEDIPLPSVGDWACKDDNLQNGLSINCIEGKLKDKTLKRSLAAYYGCITHIDHQIGRLMQALFDSGDLNNTVILFVSDHGDMLGEHNLFRKAYPYEGSAGIPFILSDPGNIIGLEHNKVRNELVELRDVMPSLLDIAGIEIPDVINGKSVLELINSVDVKWRDYIHGEHSFGEYSNQFIVTNKDKYIWYTQTGEEQYFNLLDDPNEMHNNINNHEYKDRINELRNILIKELEEREEGYSDGEKLIAGRVPKAILKHISK
ncbi:MAG: arylsulfatase [Vallitalea sp.]|jgi:arylsulfatase A-like enzyme|nr:arylsulfatase [Vallitalea sp.]